MTTSHDDSARTSYGETASTGRLATVEARLARLEGLMGGLGRAGTTGGPDQPVGSDGPITGGQTPTATRPTGYPESIEVQGVVVPSVIEALTEAVAEGALEEQSDPRDVTGAGHFMSTRAIFNADGLLHAYTTTWSENWVVGFTGGVMIGLSDEGRNILGHTDLHSFGVDGKGIFWKASHRVDHWEQYFDQETRDRTTKLYILHMHTPHPRLQEIMDEILQTVNVVDDFIRELCKIVPSICGG